MRKIREAVRLRAGGLTLRQIAASQRAGRSTASEYLRRAERAGLCWPLPEGVADSDLEARLFRPQGGETRRGLATPDWPTIHRELRRKSVTLSLLWEEYRAVHPDGYGYSRFCELYRRWEGRLAPTMRQHHIAGEKLFVGYGSLHSATTASAGDAGVPVAPSGAPPQRCKNSERVPVFSARPTSRTGS